jgi:RNA polymerase sigma-70 factor (ECF subfamily)
MEMTLSQSTDSSNETSARLTPTLEIRLMAALAGDQQAYALFLRECLPYLRARATKLVDSNMRDDLVQETLIAIHKVKHTYDNSCPVRPWLAGIMRFKAKEAWRKAKNRHAFISLDDDSIALIDAQYPNANNADAQDAEIINLAELTAQLNAHLKPESAQALIATKIKGHSVEATAKTMGRTPSWVKVTVHRAIKTLRNELMEALK